MSTPAELPEQLARRVTSVRTIVLAAAALVGLGLTISGIVFHSKYVSASEYTEHLQEEKAVKTTVDSDHAVIQYIHEDLEDIRKQNELNAQAVGAPVIPHRHQWSGQ